jgi:hypothetical protein
MWAAQQFFHGPALFLLSLWELLMLEENKRIALAVEMNKWLENAKREPLAKRSAVDAGSGGGAKIYTSCPSRSSGSFSVGDGKCAKADAG